MKNQHSEQYSKYTMIDASLQNAIGLFSLVIDLSLAEVGQKRIKTITVSQKKKPVLGFKMMESYQNIRFFGLHCSVFSTQQYIKIRTEKCLE